MEKTGIEQENPEQALSTEDKLKELQKQVEALTDELNKSKTAMSKANSQAADYKRQLAAKQTEQEKAEAERAEREQAREAELQELRREKQVNGYKSKLMEAGVDPTNADLMAKALPDGVADEYFAATKSFFDVQRQRLESENLGKQPGLSIGTPPSGKTAEEQELANLRKYIGL